MSQIKALPAPTVLDASAILALLFNEPNSDTVATALQHERCMVTAANHAEVIAKLLDRGLSPPDVAAALSALPMQVIDSTAADGEAAGYMRSASRAIGLSLGDRLCLATAQRLGGGVITADRAWLALGSALNLSIVCIR